MYIYKYAGLGMIKDVANKAMGTERARDSCKLNLSGVVNAQCVFYKLDLKSVYPHLEHDGNRHAILKHYFVFDLNKIMQKYKTKHPLCRRTISKFKPINYSRNFEIHFVAMYFS